MTCLLCGIALAVALEGVSFKRPFPEVAPTIGLLFVGGLICWHALKRFLFLLEEANRLAEHSTCAQCGKYGVFAVVEQYPRLMRVRCRKCSNEWTMAT